MTAEFKVFVRDDVGYDKTYTFGCGRVSIGRADSNDITMSERNVSRQHAAFEFEQEGAWVEDLGSYNGLYVNGERRVERVALRVGDVVTVGDFSIEVEGELLPEARHEETTNPGMMLAGEPTNPGFTLDSDDPIVTMESGQFRAMTDDDLDVTNDGSPRIEKTAIIRMDADISEIKSTQVDTFEEVAGFLMGTGDWLGQEFAVQTSELVIGRADDSDIVLNHRSVSARHAMLMTRHGRSRLLDLGSSNGTLVNGETYADVELQSGDRVQLGHTTFIYTTGFDAERTRQQIQAQAEQTGGADASSQSTPVAAQATDSKGFPLGLAMVGLAVIALSGWVFMNQADSPDKQKPPVETATKSTAEEGPEKLDKRAVENRLNEVRAAMTQRRWSMSLELIGSLEGQVSEADSATLTGLRADALLNQSAESELLKAKQSSAQGAWDEAFNALSAIDPQSVYYEEASGLKVRAQGALVDERVARIRQAITDGNLRAGLNDDLDELQGLSPEKYQELSAELKAARARAARKASEASKPKTASRPAAKSASKAVVRPTAKPAPKPEAKPQPSSKPSVSNKAIGYASTGTKAYNSGDYEGALAAFKLCLKIAPTYGNCLLGIGVAYEKLSNFAKAKENFVKFLKHAPEHKHAELVKRKLKRIESR